jgi:SnoaL-like domain
VVDGHDDILAVKRVQFQEMPPTRFYIEEIVAWKEGIVGWITGRALMVIEGMPTISTRSTVVVCEEGAYWRVVHWHFSMPVANENALGVGLTTAVDEILTMVQEALLR